MKLSSHLQSSTPRWFASVACLFALICAFVCLPKSASAAERTWTGLGANTRILTTANWSGNTAPGAGDTILFAGSGTFSQKGEDEYVAFDSNSTSPGAVQVQMACIRLS
ncbi:hypothetical protein [Ereboglobus luteus]|uniref:hypothetical protein n=1 Tax=Ereboglobus luteus TaxID=1796921 RepID=UPI000D5530AF|nr:hypothetical protein [Ereboglobus luteus]